MNHVRLPLNAKEPLAKNSPEFGVFETLSAITLYAWPPLTFDDQALTSATTVSWNANTQQVATLTLGHNATIANATNHSSGGVYIMRVTQAAAPKTLAWSTGYKWPGNTAPTMTATASAIDVFTFVSDGTYLYGSFSGSQNFTWG